MDRGLKIRQAREAISCPFFLFYSLKRFTSFTCIAARSRLQQGVQRTSSGNSAGLRNVVGILCCMVAHILTCSSPLSFDNRSNTQIPCSETSILTCHALKQSILGSLRHKTPQEIYPTTLLGSLISRSYFTALTPPATSSSRPIADLASSSSIISAAVPMESLQAPTSTVTRYQTMCIVFHRLDLGDLRM